MQLREVSGVPILASPHASTSTFTFMFRMCQLAAKQHAMLQQPDLWKAEDLYSEADNEPQLCMLFPSEMR